MKTNLQNIKLHKSHYKIRNRKKYYQQKIAKGVKFLQADK